VGGSALTLFVIPAMYVLMRGGRAPVAVTATVPATA
jgi:hypothetical protein